MANAKKIFVPFIFSLVAFALFSIKAKILPISSEEAIIIQNSHSFKEAIAASRHFLSAPFFYSITTAFHLFTDKIYLLRLPAVLANTMLVLAIYYFLENLSSKYFSFFIIIVPVLALFFLPSAFYLNSFIYGALFAFLSFWYGYQIFSQSKEIDFFSLAVLAASFAILPMISFYAFYHLAVLFLALLFFIIFYTPNKLESFTILFLLALFSLIMIVPYGDIVVNFAKNIFGFPLKIFNFHQFSLNFLGNQYISWIVLSLIIIFILIKIVRHQISRFDFFLTLYFFIFLFGFAIIPVLQKSTSQFLPMIIWAFCFFILSFFKLCLPKSKNTP